MVSVFEWDSDRLLGSRLVVEKMDKVPLNIELHANQDIIHACEANYSVCMCGKRFGKTIMAEYKLTKWAGVPRYKNGIFGYIAPTYGQAKNIAWGGFKNLIPKQLIKRIVENELLITLINDAHIRLFGADNMDSLRGIKFHDVVIDEAAYIDKYIWNNIIRGQLLGSMGQPSGRALFISSPLNPLKSLGKDKTDWYPEFYQEAVRKNQAGDKNWAGFHFTIYDNPTLNRADIDELRADSTDDEWNVEYLANPSAHAGHVYSEFDYAKHVVEVENKGMLVRGIDWGIDHPTVCLWVKVDVQKKEIYVDDEFVKSDFVIEESVAAINKKTGGTPVEWNVCDPSMNSRLGVKTSNNAKSKKEEFDRLGMYLIPGDNNDRGYNIVKMFLKKGHIKINPKCRILIKQLKDLQWGQDINDDCPDVLRYICTRIHDTLFKWNPEVVKEEPKSNPNTFNVKWFQGNKKYENKIMEEVRRF